MLIQGVASFGRLGGALNPAQTAAASETAETAKAVAGVAAALQRYRETQRPNSKANRQIVKTNPLKNR